MSKKDSTPSPETIAKVFSMMGKKGGPARAKALKPEDRKAIARKAAKARWGKKKK